MSLLLVDDNPDDRASALRCLGERFPGLEMIEAGDADSFAGALDRAGWVVAVVEYRLAWSDGLSVARALKLRHPGLPVVMFTGFGNEAVAVSALKAGLDDYVSKSVEDADRLASAVAEAIGRVRSAEDRGGADVSPTNFLAAIVESSDDAVIGKTLDGIITSWNAGAERIYGYAADEVIGRHVGLLVPPDHGDEVPGLLAQIRCGERIAHFETRRRRKDGTIIDVSLSLSPILDEAGWIVGASKIARDVTERKRTEREIARLNQELQNRVEELQTLLEILPVGVWIGDPEMEQILGNRAAYEMLGLPQGLNVSPACRDARAGAGPGFRYFRDGREIPAEELPMRAAVRRRATIRDFEQDVVFDDGRVVTIRGSASPLYDDRGMIRGAVAACADITDRKQAEEALREADRRKDDFLAMLGHELRNPLAPVRNAVQILNLVGGQTPEAREARAMIDRQVEHMSRLIDDLLDVSRIARGKIGLRIDRCDLARIVREIVSDHRPAMERSGLSLDLDVSERPLWVLGDPTRLRQVMGNLLNNAEKFTDAGGRVSVSVAAIGDGSGGERAQVAVRDTGIGINPEMLDRVFEPFRQADNGLVRAQGGLGLGLALVRGLVELHGGEVRAASEGVGRGSEFLVTLPIEPVEAPGVSSAPEGTTPGGRARVLIVEDSVDAAESLRRLLALLGYEVDVAIDGRSAMARVGSFGPDIVLCDIALPGGLSGLDIARALRDDPATAGLSLVALTGYGREDDRTRALEAGFDLHLTKPVELDRLRAILADPPRHDRSA